MKTKDLKKKIKDDIYLLTPDVISKIDFKNIEIEEKELEVKKSRFKTNSFAFILSAAFGFIIILTIFLTNLNTAPYIQTRSLSFETKEEIYSVSCFSSVMLLYQHNQVSVSAMSNEGENPLLVNNQIDILNQYLNFLEPLVNNNDESLFEIKTSTKDTFKREVKFTSKLLDGTVVDYVLYYNETKTKNETLFKGIMEFLNEEYSFEGKLIKVNKEEKLSLKAFQIENIDNYIEVEYKKENTKEKFNYSIYENDEEIFESEIKIELSSKELIIELIYETEDKEINFLIYKEINANQIHVDYEIENEIDEEGYILISVVYDEALQKNVYSYEIHSGDFEFEFEKDRVVEDDDEDDEEEDDEEDD